MHKIDSAILKNTSLEQFRALLLDQTQQNFRESTLPLKYYQQLVAIPLIDHQNIKNLVVVPHGQLNHIPFDAFLTTEPKPNQPLPYLVYDYAVSYTPSMTLRRQAKNTQDYNEFYYGFAPDYQGDNLPQLQGSVNEVSFAKNLFNGKLFVDKQATEGVFKSNIEASKILHLAMHALVDDQDPMNSRLVFTADSSETDDGRLFAHEIYNLNLPSELAVLSACNTGFGENCPG